MESMTIGRVHLAGVSRYIRIAIVAITATAGLLAGQVYLDLGGLLAGWMASAQPIFMTLGVSRTMANPGFTTGLKLIAGRLVRAMFY